MNYKYTFLLLLLLIGLFLISCEDSKNTPVTPTETTITVSAPQNGDTLRVGSSFDIKWTSNSTSKVKIEYSTDYGVTWKLIDDNVENNGNYTWYPVPNLVTSLGKIRISTVDSTTSNISAGAFNVLKSAENILVLSKPKGGELLYINESFRIEWVSSGVTSIRIEFSVDNGSTYNIIAGTFPADSGYYLWNPIPNFPSTQCFLKITDVSNESLSDKSKSTFTIVSPQVIKVTSPKGGEIWAGNSTQSINWYSSQIAAVKIEYTSDNGNSWTTITSNTQSTGTYQWNPIPNTPSNNARIRISDAEDGFPSVASDSVFTISPQSVLKIVCPNGGETWMSGSSQTIRWNSLSSLSKQGNQGNKLTTISNVKIEYTSNNGNNWTTVVASTANNGSFLWSPIPSETSSLCRVKISDAEGGVPYVISENAFTINASEPKSIAITSPNGGEIWEAGTTQAITWNSTAISAVNLDYTTNNGIEWLPIKANLPSTGYYSWTHVPNNPSTNCKVKVSDAQNVNLSSASTLTFTIVPPSQITVTSPNGGESWLIGTINEIRWTSINVDSVKLEYTINGGGVWNTIEEKIPNNGLYKWAVPQTLYKSDLCQIRISEYQNGAPFDVTDGYFSILSSNNFVRLTFPNGGEFIYQDTLITWLSTGITNVDIEFTDDNGLTWNPIVSGYRSTGAYYWMLPPGPPSTLSRIRIYDSGDHTVTDMSDSYFYLHIKEGLNIESPLGGSTFGAASDMNISWRGSNKITSVKIEFWDNKTRTWHLIADNVPSTYKTLNHYQWKGTIQTKGNIQLRITDTKGKYSAKSGVITIN